MDILRYIAYAVVIAFGIIMTGMFYLFCAYGNIYIGEHNPVIRGAELATGIIIFCFGIYMFVRELKK